MSRKILGIIISVFLAVALLFVMLARVWDDLLVTIQYLDPLYILPAIGICLVGWIVRGWRYQIILGNLQVAVRFVFATACIFFSQTVNLIVPARLGDFIRILIIRHDYEATVSVCLSSLVIERFFDILTVAFLGLVSLLFVLDVPDWFIPVILIPLILSVFFALFLLFAGTIAVKNPIFSFILTMLDEVKTASLTKRSLALLSTTSIIIWVLEAFVCLCVTLMFSEQIPFVLIMLAIVIGNLVKAIPLTPGGIGTYELAVAITLEIGGIAPVVATLIAVIDHLIKNVITLACGIATIPYFGQWILPALADTVKRNVIRSND